MEFDHEALEHVEEKKLIYTAMSKHLFYYRMFISKFVLEAGGVPLNPFMLFDYFLLDSIDRNLIRGANNAIVLKADEIWVFGPISNGVLAEIVIAQKAGKPIRYYKIEKPHAIVPQKLHEAMMEEDVKKQRALMLPSL